MKTLFTFIITCFFSVTILAQIINDEPNMVFDSNDEVINPYLSFLADLDNDGDQDVITMTLVTSGLNVNDKLVYYENLDGEGEFSLAKLIDEPSSGSRDAVSGDINNDGFQDIVIVSSDGSVTWYENLDGQGNFEKHTTVTDLFLSSSVEVADLDGDGDLDIITASGYWFGGSTIGYIGWLENLDGNGTFSSFQEIDGSSGAGTIEASDLDNDGDLDFVVGGKISFSWYENLDGTGNSWSGRGIYNSQFGVIQKVEIVDITGDNLEEILFISDKTGYYPNMGGGEFGDFTQIDPEGGNWIQSDDIDGDGDADVLFSSDDGGLHVFENTDGLGSFDTIVILQSTDFNSTYNFLIEAPSSIKTADIDEDGDVDILANYFPTKVGWYKNNINEQGSFENLEVINNGIIDLKGLKVSDLGADGDLDILSISSGDDRISLFENINGAGEFGKQQTISTSGDSVRDAFFVDIDNDGDNDVVAISKFDQKIAWYENLGENQFSSQNIISNAYSDLSILVILDIDTDGYSDILVGPSEGNILWYKNIEGSGEFELQPLLDEIGSVISITYADLDNDEDLDLIVGHQTSSNPRIEWAENLDGLGSFGELNPIDYNVRLVKIFPIDLDDDGDQDLVVGTERSVEWYINLDGQGDFSEPQVLVSSSSFSQTLVDIQMEDLNMDNNLDLIFLVKQFNDFSRLLWSERLDTGPYFSQPNLILSSLPHAEILITKDLDNDDDIDVLIGTVGDLSDVFWYENVLSQIPISGYCFYDENENQIRDANEIDLPNQVVQVTPGPVSSYPVGNGKFRFDVDPGIYEVTAIPAELWQLTTDSIITVDFNGQSITNVNFGFIPTVDLSIVEPDITSGPTRCGFDVPFWFSIQNSGTTVDTGFVDFILTRGDLVLASPAPDSILGDTLRWNFENLVPSDQKDFYMMITMPGAENLGDTLEFVSTTYLLNSTMDVIENTTYTYNSVLNCAYDPNDKTVIPSGVGLNNYTLFDTDFEYIIRFQNTGTDTAFTVRIEDTLDDNLDWSTFKPISASHDYAVDLDNENGKITFLFENILLPDSTTNEVESHGFVKYRISPNDNLSEETPILNNASIFFDFNDPIVTNTVRSLMVSEYPSIDIGSSSKNTIVYKIIPNPSKEFVKFHYELNEPSTWELMIYNSMGQIIQYESNLQTETESGIISINDLPIGIYFISFQSNDQIISDRLIIISD